MPSKRCPTCNCDHMGQTCGNLTRLHLSCPDPWHDSPSESATAEGEFEKALENACVVQAAFSCGETNEQERDRAYDMALATHASEVAAARCKAFAEAREEFLYRVRQKSNSLGYRRKPLFEDWLESRVRTGDGTKEGA